NARTASSSSSSPPTVRATAMICAPALASASAVACPMPREAPVTRAMRSARGLASSGMEVLGTAALAIPQWSRAVRSARFGQQGQLPWRGSFLAGEVAQRRRVVAGETMVGELRACRIAALFAHGAIKALDGQERQRVGIDQPPHALEVVYGGKQLVALGRVDP